MRKKTDIQFVKRVINSVIYCEVCFLGLLFEQSRVIIEAEIRKCEAFTSISAPLLHIALLCMTEAKM